MFGLVSRWLEMVGPQRIDGNEQDVGLGLLGSLILLRRGRSRTGGG